MIDPFDYKEPGCLMCEGEEFYNYDPEKPQGSIPIRNILQKVDDSLNREDYDSVKSTLSYWLQEAKMLKDKRGELTLQSELMGLYRKLGDKDNAVKAAERGLTLIEELGIEQSVSAATIFINAATVFKTFGLSEKSLPLFQRSEKLYTDNLDKNDPRFGALYNNYGLALADCGRTDEAEKSFKQAIEIMEKNENGSTECAITLLNMADLFFDNDERATELCEKAWMLLISDDIAHDTYTAFVYKKCAPAFRAHGFFLKAGQLETEADKIYARS